MYGCEQDSIIPDRWKIREWLWQRCPIKLITEQTQQYIRAYNLLQTMGTPYQRGWLKESNKFIEAVVVIDTEIKRLAKDNLKQMRKK